MNIFMIAELGIFIMKIIQSFPENEGLVKELRSMLQLLVFRMRLFLLEIPTAPLRRRGDEFRKAL